MTPNPTAPGTGGVAPLSPLIHGRVRLLIISHLIRSGPAAFMELRTLLGLTDGTLSVHLTKLADGGIIEIEKRFEGKKPRTVVKLTRIGRSLFKTYVKELAEIVPGLSE